MKEQGEQLRRGKQGGMDGYDGLEVVVEGGEKRNIVDGGGPVTGGAVCVRSVAVARPGVAAQTT